jgi:hypothetical protein
VASERQKKRPQTRETQKQKKQKKKNGGVGGDAQGLAHCLFLVARCLKNKKNMFLMNISFQGGKPHLELIDRSPRNQTALRARCA